MHKLSIVTPVRKLVYDQPVKEAFIQTYKGELNILEGHAPLMTVLETGVLRYIDQEGGEYKFAISLGYCEVAGDEISVLAETAEAAEEIDAKRAEFAYEDSMKRLDMAGLGESELEKYMRKKKRASVRLSLTK